MFDISDESTGLPPLHEITPEDSFLVLQWQVGAEGLVTVDSEKPPVPVRYLSLRGLQMDDEGEPCFSQVHMAMPTEIVGPLLEAWAETLVDTPVEPGD